MRASSSKPTTQSLPCTSLSFSPPVRPPLLSQLPMLLPSQLPPRSLSPSLPLLSPETTPLDLPAFTTPSPLLLPLSQLLVLVSPRLPPMAFPQSDRLPRLPSLRTSSSPLSSGDTRLPTKQSNFHNINQS